MTTNNGRTCVGELKTSVIGEHIRFPRQLSCASSIRMVYFEMPQWVPVF